MVTSYGNSLRGSHTVCHVVIHIAVDLAYIPQRMRVYNTMHQTSKMYAALSQVRKYFFAESLCPYCILLILK